MFPFFGIVSSLFVFVYLAFIILAIITIYRWVTRFITLREEQNEILREISRKLDKKD